MKLHTQEKISSVGFKATVKLEELHQIISTGNFSLVSSQKIKASDFLKYRSLDLTLPQNKAAYDNFKRSLPCFVAGSTFKTIDGVCKRQSTYVDKDTQLAYIDLDYKDNPILQEGRYEEVRNTLANIPGIVLISRSTGKGMFALFQYHLAYSPVNKEQLFSYLNQVMTKHGLVMDKATKDIATRLTVIPYDPEAVYNPDNKMLFIVLNEHLKKLAPVSQPVVQLKDEAVAEIYSSDTAESTMKAIAKAYEHLIIGDGHCNNEFTYNTASALNRHGFSGGEILKFFKENYKYYDAKRLADMKFAAKSAYTPQVTSYMGGTVTEIDGYINQYYNQPLPIPVNLCANTGSGKSTFIIQQFTEHFQGQKKFFLVPTAAIAMQLATLHPHVACKTQNFTQGVPETNNVVVLCTQGFKAFVKSVGGQKQFFEKYPNCIIAIDEAHEHSATRYLIEEVSSILDMFKAANNKNIITISGTPVPTCHPELNTAQLSFKSKQAPRHVHLHHITNKQVNRDFVVQQTKLAIANGQKAFIPQRTKDSVALVTILQAEGIDGRKILLLNSDKKFGDRYQAAIKNESVAEYDVIIATDVVKQGVNFNDECEVRLIVSREAGLSIRDIEQFSARFRKASKIDIDVNFYEGHDKLISFNFNSVRNLAINASIAARDTIQLHYPYLSDKERENIINNVNKDNNRKSFSAEIGGILSLTDNTFVRASTDNTHFGVEVDYLACDSYALSLETAAMYKSIHLFKHMVSVFNLGTVDIIREEVEEFNKKHANEVKGARAKALDAKERNIDHAHSIILDEVKDKGLQALDSLVQGTHDSKNVFVSEEAYKTIRSIGFFHNAKSKHNSLTILSRQQELELITETLTFVRNHITTKKDINRLDWNIRFHQHNLQNSSIVTGLSAHKVAEIYKAIRRATEDDSSISYSQIRDIAHNIDRNISDTKLGELVKKMFDTKVSRQGKQKKQTYDILSDTAFGLNYNEYENFNHA